MMTSVELRDYLLRIIQTLPDSPGVYQYFDKDQKLIYVGKAKSLKKRVGSYFHTSKHEYGKTRLLVKNIADIKTIKVATEMDALLLENNLIKKHQPKYNINLKDDKTYPWIIIKKESFPRVFYTRKLIKDGSEYYGPYTSVKMIQTLIDLFKDQFKLRTCQLPLSEANIAAQKFKVCLEYHIGNCKAPCIGLVQAPVYDGHIDYIRQILKGNIHLVINHLKQQMKTYADGYQFEEAQRLKEQLDAMESFHKKSVVVNPAIHNVDVFSIITDEEAAYVNFLKVMNGAIIQAHTVEIKKKLDETEDEILQLAIADIREKFHSDSKELILPFEPELDLLNVNVTVPKIGDKKHLLDLSIRNLQYYIKEKKLQLDKVNPENKINRLLALMQRDLRLTTLPRHIECFDNSNLQGDYAVAAMSVFKNAKPSKRDYRHYNIKTVTGPDDFASMEEVIYRRYKRVLEEALPLPQLIVIDGGKGQLSSALNSLQKLDLLGKVAIIGIAKKLEEIYYPGDSVPMYLDKKSETLRVIQHLRDEVHRFGITHHRKKRSKEIIKTELDQIVGIGSKTAEALLTHFKSVKNIEQVTIDQLAAVVGQAKAILVHRHFNPEP
ncbi:MAG: excinuclease subunit UvrC [Bacteroidota bacterium]|jgi:excinuclease ABC subunit C